MIEPLRELFKDEVRDLGRQLGIPEDLVMRHPFPGPGIAIRIIGEVTPERVQIARKADHVYVLFFMRFFTANSAYRFSSP